MPDRWASRCSTVTSSPISGRSSPSTDRAVVVEPQRALLDQADDGQRGQAFRAAGDPEPGVDPCSGCRVRGRPGRTPWRRRSRRRGPPARRRRNRCWRRARRPRLAVMACSTVEHAHLGFVVVLAGRRGDPGELGELLAGEPDIVGRHVLLQPGNALGPGDRDDVVTLGEQPGQRHLRGRRAGLGGDLPHLVGHAAGCARSSPPRTGDWFYGSRRPRCRPSTGSGR